MSLDKELAAFIASYEACWRAKDWNGLGRHWDQSHPAFYYLAEEMEEPFYAFEGVSRYWNFNGKLIKQMNMKTARHRFRLLSDDIASLVYKMAWGAALDAPSGIEGKPIGGDVWVMALARRSSDGWKYFHYVEAPYASLPYLARVHERQADDAKELFS
jgi:hypothetical protein